MNRKEDTLCAKFLKFLTRLLSEANDRVRTSRECNIYIYIYFLESTLHQRVQFKFREVGYTASFLPVAFTPSRQPVPLPFVPFLAPYARFYGLPSKFAPSSRSMKLVSRFLGEGRPRYVAVQFPATFYVVFCSDRKKRKKKNREKYILHRYLSKRVRILFRAELEHTWWLVTKFSSLFNLVRALRGCVAPKKSKSQ